MIRSDLRLVALAAVVWAGTLLGLLAPPIAVGLVACVAGMVVLIRSRSTRVRLHEVAWWAAFVVASGGAFVRVESVQAGVMARLAAQGAVVQAEVRLASDPVVRQGRFGTYAVARATVLQVQGRGGSWTPHDPVMLVGPAVPGHFGQVIRVVARASLSEDLETPTVLRIRGPPQVVAAASPWAIAEPVRRALRDSAASLPSPQRYLVPALVDGDDGGLPVKTIEQFRVAGLSHLLAVSGTNLTLLVGNLLLLGRLAGVRARGLLILGALGVVGFVLLARPEPSVLRAAVMGSVSLVGLASGRDQGLRALGAAVLGLLLVDPWLAVSWGFALSVAATAGILIWAPPWRDALASWLPRVVADALAVPLAAQIATTPLVAGLSGQVSLAGVAANVVVGPVIGPATMLGMGAGLGGVLWGPLGRAFATAAGWAVGWLVVVAETVATLPTPAVSWAPEPWSLLVLVVLTLVASLVLTTALRRPLTAVGLAIVSLGVVLIHWVPPGWPAPGWVFAVCDIGQGDGLVLNAGHGAGVVIDTGPDPALMDRCLRRLNVRAVPVVILTHFHQDHVGGLAGVLPGRAVKRIEVTDLAAPADMVEQVHRIAGRAQTPVVISWRGERGSVGDVTWELVAPVAEPAETMSPPNDASLVMLATVRGVRILMMGDQEVPAQELLHRALPGLRADVLKVAHHGSAKQVPELISGLGADLAVISVGADNDYGHPAPSTTSLLQRLGMTVRRTDRDGDIVVSVGADARLRVSTAR